MDFFTGDRGPLKYCRNLITAVAITDRPHLEYAAHGVTFHFDKQFFMESPDEKTICQIALPVR